MPPQGSLTSRVAEEVKAKVEHEWQVRIANKKEPSTPSETTSLTEDDPSTEVLEQTLKDLAPRVRLGVLTRTAATLPPRGLKALVNILAALSTSVPINKISSTANGPDRRRIPGPGSSYGSDLGGARPRGSPPGSSGEAVDSKYGITPTPDHPPIPPNGSRSAPAAPPSQNSRPIPKTSTTKMSPAGNGGNDPNFRPFSGPTRPVSKAPSNAPTGPRSMRDPPRSMSHVAPVSGVRKHGRKRKRQSSTQGEPSRERSPPKIAPPAPSKSEEPAAKKLDTGVTADGRPRARPRSPLPDSRPDMRDTSDAEQWAYVENLWAQQNEVARLKRQREADEEYARNARALNNYNSQGFDHWTTSKQTRD